MIYYSPAAMAYAKNQRVTHGTGCICVACENDCKAYDAALASVAPIQPRVLTTAVEHSPYSDAAWFYVNAVDTPYGKFGPEERESLAAAFDAMFTPHPQPERVLTTAAELDALPVGAVVLDRTGLAYQRAHLWAPAHEGYLERDAKSLARDRGALRLLVPAAPKPVRLTADDPRYRDGAKVRGVYEDGTAVEGFVRDHVLVAGDCTTNAIYRNRVYFTAVYLLAEAPDPDAERLSAVVEWLGQHGVTTSDSRDLLTLLDSVVKRADS